MINAIRLPGSLRGERALDDLRAPSGNAGRGGWSSPHVPLIFHASLRNRPSAIRIPKNLHTLHVAMETSRAIHVRRSVKRFTERTVPRERIEALLELAVLAPNHRMTEPWGFVILGPEARRAYGRIKGERRAQAVNDPEVAESIRQQTIWESVAVPAMLAFTQRLDDDPDVREEDFATVYMGMQNVLLAAVEAGLGTHVKTGQILEDPATRALIGVGEDERIVALVHLGEPAELPDERPREPARTRTRWLA